MKLIMKIKRLFFILMSFVFFAIIFFANESKAAITNLPIYLGIQEFRTDSDPVNMAYGINNPEDNGSSAGTTSGAKIWDIVRYNSTSDSVFDNSVDYYCVRAGVGFRDTDAKAVYDILYNFKTDKSKLASANNKYLNLLAGDDVYYKILAMSDLMYIEGQSTEAEKQELITNALKSAHIDPDEFAVEITNSDIEAIQQAALWYFTNQDDPLYDSVYNQLSDYTEVRYQEWFTYKIKGENRYKPLSDYGSSGEQRQYQAIAIYNYLINTAIANEQSYKEGTVRSRSIITLYANSTDENEQPVIVIEKEPAEFDLALRKYITKVNSQNVSVSRNPVIDTQTLNSGTTATYKHKKDPVNVKYGDTVTYNITIYNEGDIAGRASKIVDQLPTGLRFSRVVTSGYTASYDEGTNRVTITKTGTNNLPAYDGKTLSSETIELECTVESVNEQVLTNVAWISEEIKQDGTVITNQEGQDRDSEPATTPSVNKDNMTNYKGTTSETDLSQNIYYPGEQDDDDFEKLISQRITGSYQIQLEKVDKDETTKKLQGAVFEVTVPGKATEQVTTNESGFVDLGTVQIQNATTTDEIIIREITPPSGYNKILDQLNIAVTKKIENASYELDEVEITSGQVEGTNVTVTGNVIKIVVANEKMEGSYQVQLEKVDKDNPSTKLQGAVFSVTMPGKQAETKTTNESGIVDLGTVNITDVSSTDTILVTETQAPSGYAKIIDTLNISVTKKIESGRYVLNTASITSGQAEGTTVSVEGNVVKIVVADKKLEGNYNIQLEKVDINDTTKKLEGAEFEITVPGKTAQKYTTNASGIIDLGTVNITDVSTADTIIVRETKAPEGYNKILDVMQIQVEKQISNNAYALKSATITTGQVEGTSVKIEGTTIKIVVANKPIEGEYKVQLEKVDIDDTSKKLEGAEFEVTLPGASSTTKKTDENGLIDLGTVKITDIKTNDTITVKETKAPDGYNKILDTMTIEVSKQITSENKYAAKEATITSGQVEGTSVSIENNIIKIVVANRKITGNYQIQLEKVDLDNPEVKLQGAVFDVTVPGKSAERKTTNDSGIIDLGTIQITDVSSTDTITVTEITPPEGYNKILDTINIAVTKKLENGKYVLNTAQITDGQVEGTKVEIVGNVVKITVADKLITGNYKLQLEKVDKDNHEIKLQGAEFEVTLPGKQPETKTTDANGIIDLGTVEITETATKDIIKIRETKAPDRYYAILASEITIEVEKEIQNGSYVVKNAVIKPDGIEGVTAEVSNGVIKITVENKLITGDYQVQLEKVDLDDETIKLPGAVFEVTLPGKTAETKTTDQNGKIDLGTVQITDVNTIDTIIVKETQAPDRYNKILDTLTINVSKKLENNHYYANVPTIVSGQVEGTSVTIENNVIKIKVANKKKEFDLSLRKFISKVNEIEYNREPVVDVTGLVNGTDTTAIYNHPKQEVSVRRNDIVIYTIRVYNEGELDGYANVITDFLPEELEFLPEHEINVQYRWTVSEDGRVVTTDYLSKENEQTEGQNLLHAFNGQNLEYKDVQIACKIKEDAKRNVKLTNIAEITEEVDEDGEDIIDRDSQDGNVEVPPDEELPGYKDDEVENEYVPGQQDDDDFEKVIVQEFDLALRKFITAVDEDAVTTRIPQVSYNEETGEISYNHTKDPVEVITGNIVTYTIRIFNEGDLAGFAKEVADDIPAGLEFLPENEINQEYRWVMYDAEGNVTENVSEAVKIVTDYLSKEQGEARMAEDETLTENPNLLKAFDSSEEISETNPDYRDVRVAFRVVEPNTSDKIIVNSAQIQEDEDENGNPIDDIDSTPGEWNEGEDDQDREYIKLTYFDLSLRKWVTQTIVIENGKETITQTGHTPDMDPEPIVKVEIHRNKLDQVTVKFRYSIRVTNEGDIAGYAREITDYVPEGLRFVAEDNPGWTDEGNNVISTRLLENTLLQPGESADVEVLLTWINGEDNLGLKTNTAEISEDYNDKGAPDIDSTPDNKVPGEDDIDDAEVILSISTGQARIYYTLGFMILITLGGGIFLIKKYVI